MKDWAKEPFVEAGTQKGVMMNLLPLKNGLTKKIGFPARVRALEGCQGIERKERWFQTSKEDLQKAYWHKGQTDW